MLLTAGLFATLALAEPTTDEAVREDGSTVTVQGDWLPELGREDLTRLKPKRHLLKPNLRGPTDYTAYTLEWGEVKLGLASITAGVLPRVQVGTLPILDAAGLYNAHAKVNAVRVGPVDLAIHGAHYRLPMGNFRATYTSVGGRLSASLGHRVGLHLGGEYASLRAHGIPDPAHLTPFVQLLVGSYTTTGIDDLARDLDPTIRADTAVARLAVDVHLNRRDSLVVQATSMVWARSQVDVGIDIEDLLGIDLTYDGTMSPLDAYVATLAYQASFKHVDLRVGAGISTLPYTWLLQSTELSVRFGGSTRHEDGRRKRTWRRNRRDATRVERGGEPEA